MFGNIGARNFDFYGGHPCPVRDFDPCIAGCGQRINRIRYHRPTHHEVIRGDGVATRYPASSRERPSIAERRIACSIESIRRCTAPILRANSRAIVVFPVPGNPPKIMSMLNTVEDYRIDISRKSVGGKAKGRLRHATCPEDGVTVAESHKTTTRLFRSWLA